MKTDEALEELRHHERWAPRTIGVVEHLPLPIPWRYVLAWSLALNAATFGGLLLAVRWGWL